MPYERIFLVAHASIDTSLTSAEAVDSLMTVEDDGTQLLAPPVRQLGRVPEMRLRFSQSLQSNSE